ncbi:HEPN domain-containing protein [Lacrimispora sp.]|jgi:hypothetical protein|uniref:HEPN domain-containing protein n=1 Tax=Lacrimispora sp. TaxID=2719234 RepID=UPI0029DF18C5|nr:hypothetical protein [Lacrimispora sp.]
MSEQKKSREYKYLNKRIAQIEKNFKFQQSINGITNLQADRLRGLRLLCHAEFEDYFESIALRLLCTAERKWTQKKSANYNLAALFMWHAKIDKNDTYETKANMIIADFRKEIKGNHGIKEDNIKKLFVPLGYKIDEFDATFISTLSSFGILRGETAHTSANKTQQPLDQITELNRIDNLLESIMDFEEVIFSKC